MKNKNEWNRNAKLWTYKQIAEDYNLGRNTIKKLALESGALYKIGKSVRIDQEKFYNYIEQNYTVKSISIQTNTGHNQK